MMQDKRVKIIQFICVVITISVIIYLFAQSSIIDGINPVADERSKALGSVSMPANNVEASFCDRNGIVLTKAEEKGEKAEYYFESEFGYIIGYNTITSGSMGLKNTLGQYLYHNDMFDNPCIITLTADSEIQRAAYRILEDNNYIGSVVVLNNKTGEIIADASRHSIAFEPSRIDEMMPQYNSVEGFFVPNSTQISEYPGSTFKIVMAAAVIEDDRQDDIYNGNGEFYIKDSKKPIKNSSSEPDIDTDLQKALTHSFNTYFADMALNKLGERKVEDIASRFLVGSEIKLDYTTLTSSLDVSNDSNLAMTGFGQAGVRISPMHLAMICQTIANDGDMLKPYLIKSVKCGMSKLESGKTEILRKDVISKSTAKELRKYLQNVAADQYEMDLEDHKFLCAKTGTAEADGGTLTTYFCCFDENYTVVISRRFAGENSYGINLKPHAHDIMMLLEDNEN